MKKVLLLLFIPIFFSCIKYEDAPVGRDKSVYRIRISLNFEEPSVKSSYSVCDTAVENFHIWVYDSNTSKLLKSFLFSETSVIDGNLDINIPKSETCTFLFLANMSGIDAPAALSEALDLRYSLDDELTLKRLFPMSHCMSGRHVFDGMTIKVNLTRMVARYVFLLDKSKLKGTFTLKSVNVRQAAMNASVFSQSAATVVADGDYASSKDLNLLQVGGPANFYMLENCRGLLSSWNTDPWKKIPSDPNEAKMATYLEVHAEYVSPTMQSSDITYRMYLGANNTKNYDITRNSTYVVTLMPSDTGITEGILQTQWKIDPGDYDVTGSLAFSKSDAVCAAVYDPPYILRNNGDRVSVISDSIYVLRSSDRLSYSLSYDIGTSKVGVTQDGDKIVFNPQSELVPRGNFDLAMTSYDKLLSDSAMVYGGVMNLKVRFKPSTGIMQMWSVDKNPRNIKLHVILNYEVQSSAWGGSSWSHLQEYKDSDKGKVEFDIIPSTSPQDVDGGQICSAIRNQSDGMVPTPDGVTQYTPNLLKLDFTISVVSPQEWKGRTLICYNSGIFEQTAVGFVNNQYYMGFWYLSNNYDGNLIFHRKTSDGETTSSISFTESCNGQVFRQQPEDYYKAAFEI